MYNVTHVRFVFDPKTLFGQVSQFAIFTRFARDTRPNLWSGARQVCTRTNRLIRTVKYNFGRSNRAVCLKNKYFFIAFKRHRRLQRVSRRQNGSSGNNGTEKRKNRRRWQQ